MMTAARRAAPVALLTTWLVACAEPYPVEIGAPEPAAATLVASVIPGGLLTCTADDGWSDTIIIGTSGIAWERNGVRIDVPPGAVPGSTRLDIVVPASRYVEVDVTANRQAHYRFRAPISITLPLTRCRVPGSDVRVSGAWYIDTESKALLEFMGGTVDADAWSVTFQTDHLSGYAIAN
jgi:hypothetical protein